MNTEIEQRQRVLIDNAFLDAQELVVCDDESYESAATLARSIKQMESKVTAYWEELRKPAKAAYDAVLAKKKQMLTPLAEAERELKRKMGAYQRQVEENARRIEQERRAAAEAEQARLMAVAEESRNNGDTLAAEMAEMEAEIMTAAAEAAVVAPVIPKAAGVSKRKDWVITGVDMSQVPVEYMGVVIRPVDERAIKRLIKTSGGTIAIPGVTYEEVSNISIRK